MTVYESFPTGQLAAGADILAFTGGIGWKGREPFLMAGRIDISSAQPMPAAMTAADASAAAEGGRPEKRRRRSQPGEAGEERGWQQQLRKTTTGFYDTVSGFGGRGLSQHEFVLLGPPQRLVRSHSASGG